MGSSGSNSQYSGEPKHTLRNRADVSGNNAYDGSTGEVDIVDFNSTYNSENPSGKVSLPIYCITSTL